QVSLTVMLAGKKFFYCLNGKWRDTKAFMQRSHKFRQFRMPTTLDPKLARAMVNLAKPEKGDRLLDAFCGSGGLLIEAGLLGLKATGVELDEKVFNGCRQNLESFGLKDFKLVNEDFLKAKFAEKFDAIVTEPPFGRSAKVSEKNLELFYKKMFDKLHELLKPSALLVLSLPMHNKRLYSNKFICLKHFSLRVHKSLTKHFFVLKKK
ncbi:RsmD family RNA methyltransferase, partial [archaeon]|nr:RsmD family RNA methyltransferase [archaeon]